MAEILSPLMPMSAKDVSAAVTTVPLRMMVSKRMYPQGVAKRFMAGFGHARKRFLRRTVQSSVGDAEHVAVGILKPGDGNLSAGRVPDAKVILLEMWIGIEDHAHLAQGFDGRPDIRDLEAENGVVVRGEIGNCGDAKSDASDVEDGGEVVLIGQCQ